MPAVARRRRRDPSGGGSRAQAPDSESVVAQAGSRALARAAGPGSESGTARASESVAAVTVSHCEHLRHLKLRASPGVTGAGVTVTVTGGTVTVTVTVVIEFKYDARPAA